MPEEGIKRIKCSSNTRELSVSRNHVTVTWLTIECDECTLTRCGDQFVNKTRNSRLSRTRENC
jgi:hypothetical protein